MLTSHSITHTQEININEQLKDTTIIIEVLYNSNYPILTKNDSYDSKIIFKTLDTFSKNNIPFSHNGNIIMKLLPIIFENPKVVEITIQIKNEEIIGLTMTKELFNNLPKN